MNGDRGRMADLYLWRQKTEDEGLSPTGRPVIRPLSPGGYGTKTDPTRRSGEPTFSWTRVTKKSFTTRRPASEYRDRLGWARRACLRGRRF